MPASSNVSAVSLMISMPSGSVTVKAMVRPARLTPVSGRRVSLPNTSTGTSVKTLRAETSTLNVVNACSAGSR